MIIHKLFQLLPKLAYSDTLQPNSISFELILISNWKASTIDEYFL